ncbi:unnamed protein product [Peronospora belbahrii]|uniref:Secreted protein n=1 Tax=Peronospora belbahrii TaxID=622444 RepID=A0ABN8D4V2_9STRA|nr:unnamed protein product [Peronospora belbahrii]
MSFAITRAWTTVLAIFTCPLLSTTTHQLPIQKLPPKNQVGRKSGLHKMEPNHSLSKLHYWWLMMVEHLLDSKPTAYWTSPLSLRWLSYIRWKPGRESICQPN